MPKAPPVVLSLKNDFMFKGVFGDKDSPATLVAFLRVVLPWLPEGEFGEIIFADTRRKRRHAEGKECILDLCVRLTSGRMINIEIQVVRLPGAANRAQYYNARMLDEQIVKGQPYAGMAQVITIFILDHVLFGGVDYHREYRLKDCKTGEELPGSQAIVFIELPKLPAESDGTAEWNWLRLFGAETREELERLVEKEPAMAEAVTKVLEMSASERNRRRAFSREMWRRDQEAILHEARTSLERGRAEGKAEGKAEGRAEVARRLLRMKMSLADIASATGLSVAEIERLTSEGKV